MAKEPIILSEQIIPPPALVRAGLESLPAIICAQGERAGRRFIDNTNSVVISNKLNVTGLRHPDRVAADICLN